MAGNDESPFKVGDMIYHRVTGLMYEVTEVTETGSLRAKWLEEGFEDFDGFIAARRLNEYEVVDAKAEATV